MFSFLIGKNLRKILKRKESDAGDRGRAFEEVWASLFSKLRIFGVSKRQRLVLFGPTVALTFNFLVSVGIILMNKLVLGEVGFNFPIFLTLIHYVFSFVLMAILKALSILPKSPPSNTKLSSFMALGIVMSLSTGLANVSLKFNSVGFYQMAKIAVTPTIVFAEIVFYWKRVSFSKVVALTVMSIGVAIATVTDLQFHFFGACIAVAWIIPSAINKVMWSNLQQKENWTALALMWKTTPITLFFLFGMMPWLDPPGVLDYNWNAYNSTVIGLSALLGFLLQWSGALALGATSATTHVVLGQFKTCAILLGGFILFGSNPGPISIGGVLIALFGVSLYTYLNLYSHQQSTKINLRQSQYMLPKSKLSKENGNDFEAVNADERV